MAIRLGDVAPDFTAEERSRLKLRLNPEQDKAFAAITGRSQTPRSFLSPSTGWPYIFAARGGQ